jgi:peptidoglycan/LPS O-acetylase OafA/YrhL
VVSVVVGFVGGVPGLTVVVAAVVVVVVVAISVAVVVAISVAVSCCSWRVVAKLTRYWSDDGDLRYQGRVEVSSFGGVGGLLIFS